MPAKWTHTGYAQQLLFGAGRVRDVTGLLRTLGARRALLVTTEGRNASEDGAHVRSALGSSTNTYGTTLTLIEYVPVDARPIEPSDRTATNAPVRAGVNMYVAISSS